MIVKFYNDIKLFEIIEMLLEEQMNNRKNKNKHEQNMYVFDTIDHQMTLNDKDYPQDYMNTLKALLNLIIMH